MLTALNLVESYKFPMEKKYNTRKNLRGLHDRSEINKVRLSIAHARNRQTKLALETQDNDAILEKLLRQEQELANGEVL